MIYHKIKHCKVTFSKIEFLLILSFLETLKIEQKDSKVMNNYPPKPSKTAILTRFEENHPPPHPNGWDSHPFFDAPMRYGWEKPLF